MPQTRRVIRRVQTGEYHTFEEERWPVNVALVVCAGFVAGAIIAVSDFDESQWLYNGWIRLSTLIVSTGLLMWAASMLPGRRFRRAIQLSAVLALMVHLVLVVVLYNQRLEYQEEIAEQEVVAFESAVTLPDYHEPTEQESHEKPIATDTPETSQSELEVERQETPTETPQESQPTPEPGIVPEIVPSPIEKAELAEAALAASEPSQLSRQTTEAAPATDEPIAAPQQTPARELEPIAADSQTIERTAEAQPKVAEAVEPQTDSPPVDISAAEIARRATPETPSDSPSLTSLDRSQATAVLPYVNDVEMLKSAAAESAREETQTPQVNVVERQVTSPTVARQAAAIPEPSAALTPSAIDASPNLSEEAPQVATSSSPNQSKRTVDARAVAIDAVDAPQATVQNNAPGRSPAPSEFQVARSTTENAAPAAVAAAGAAANATPSTTNASAPSSPTISRATPSPETTQWQVTLGGAKQPGRSVGAAPAAQTVAEDLTPASSTEAGLPTNVPTAAAVGSVAKSNVSLPRSQTAVPLADATSSQAAAAARSTSVPTTQGSSRPSDASAPQVATTGSANFERKTPAARLPVAPISPAEIPTEPTKTAAEVPTRNPLSPSRDLASSATAARSVDSAAAPLEVAKIDGPGGLRYEPQPTIGSISRPARREPVVAHPGTARFIQKSAGGPLVIDGRAREPAEAFSRRRGRKVDPSESNGQPIELTERAVELGLEFLARHQSKDGSWSLHNYGAGKRGYERETSQLHSDTAATGLALLAFLGAGYDHYDDKYSPQIRQGLEYLVKNQKSDGDLFVTMDSLSNKSVWLYSHGIAAIALCEAVGMTGDAELRGPAQKAIDFIVAAQNKRYGGWRYVPGRDSDTSVSGWQLMALKSGELAGLKVPKETYLRVEQWLDLAESAPDGQTQYAYNPNASLDRLKVHGRRPTAATTSMGLLMRLYTGWNRDDPRMKSGCDYLLSNQLLTDPSGNPLQNSYYWYYATQLMFHMKGDYWKRWNDHVHPTLVGQQIQTGSFAGSWDPRFPVPDRWGPQAGRMYVTTLNLLSLEVYYRHLPIYEQTAK